TVQRPARLGRSEYRWNGEIASSADVRHDVASPGVGAPRRFSEGAKIAEVRKQPFEFERKLAEGIRVLVAGQGHVRKTIELLRRLHRPRTPLLLHEFHRLHVEIRLAVAMYAMANFQPYFT